jgi:hypothetical protein
MVIASWLGWFTQHSLGKLLWMVGLGWLLAALGRCLYCGWQLRSLEQSLRQLPCNARSEVDRLFSHLSIDRLSLVWSAGPEGLRSWNLEYWAHPLLGPPRWSLWPLGFLLASPLLTWLGYLQGYRRFDKELQFLNALQPWEGLRALQIVRHAVNSLMSWAEPLVAAGLGALLLALLVWLTQRLLKVALVRQLRAVQVELLRIFPVAPQELLNQQIEQLTQIVLELREEVRQLRESP